jgi:hypothetical protein
LKVVGHEVKLLAGHLEGWMIVNLHAAKHKSSKLKAQSSKEAPNGRIFTWA